MNHTIHWQRITDLLPKLEAAAYRRYPQDAKEFIDLGIDALLELPVAAIDPDSPDSHTDSYLVQHAVYAGQRVLWAQYNRANGGEGAVDYTFSDLSDNDGTISPSAAALLSDEAAFDFEEDETVADDLELTEQEARLLTIIQEAIAEGQDDLFYSNGKLQQHVLVKIGLFSSKSAVNRAMEGLRQKLAFAL